MRAATAISSTTTSTSTSTSASLTSSPSASGRRHDRGPPRHPRFLQHVCEVDGTIGRASDAASARPTPPPPPHPAPPSLYSRRRSRASTTSRRSRTRSSHRSSTATSGASGGERRRRRPTRSASDLTESSSRAPAEHTHTLPALCPPVPTPYAETSPAPACVTCEHVHSNIYWARTKTTPTRVLRRAPRSGACRVLHRAHTRMSFPPPTSPKLGQSASAPRVGGSNPKIDHTALRVQQTELASSPASTPRCRRPVRRSRGRAALRAAATAPRPGAAAASLSIPRAVAAAPSRTLRSVGNFSLATDPAHLSPWERRVRAAAAPRACVDAVAAQRARRPRSVAAVGRAATRVADALARAPNVRRQEPIGATWPSPGAEKAAAPAYMRERALPQGGGRAVQGGADVEAAGRRGHVEPDALADATRRLEVSRLTSRLQNFYRLTPA